jgi:hypothetical protein
MAGKKEPTDDSSHLPPNPSLFTLLLTFSFSSAFCYLSKTGIPVVDFFK